MKYVLERADYMKLWKLNSDDNGYCHVNVSNGKDLEKLFEYSSTSFVIKEWEPMQIKRLYKGKWGDKPDFFTGVNVFSKKAIEALEDLIVENAQILPLAPEKNGLFLIHTTKVLDCIDYEKAKPIRSGSIPVVGFEKYAFIEEKVKDQHMFKVHLDKVGYSMVSDAFRNRVLESGLEGFWFEQVWDSEELPLSEEQKEQAYQAELERIEREKGTEVDFEEAYGFVQNGYVVQSGEFRMKLNEQKQLLIGTLNHDCEYTWIQPVFYPPVFLSRKWHLA